MHPEILRLMTEQRGREMRTRAHQARLVRMIKSARRGGGLTVTDDADEFVPPPIPDYVDGSFRTDAAGAGALAVDGTADGQAPAAQRAA